jgi:hypothetical protein
MQHDAPVAYRQSREVLTESNRHQTRADAAPAVDRNWFHFLLPIRPNPRRGAVRNRAWHFTDKGTPGVILARKAKAFETLNAER